MPEEINRIVTDAIADLLWTPSADADENLRQEGVASEKIDRVGNIMIDSLELMRPKIEARRFYGDLDLRRGQYGVVTLHRPVNVDNIETLSRAVRTLAQLARDVPLIFPVHPRTRKMLQAGGLPAGMQRSQQGLFYPVVYLGFMK